MLEHHFTVSKERNPRRILPVYTEDLMKARQFPLECTTVMNITKWDGLQGRVPVKTLLTTKYDLNEI